MDELARDLVLELLLKLELLLELLLEFATITPVGEREYKHYTGLELFC